VLYIPLLFLRCSPFTIVVHTLPPPLLLPTFVGPLVKAFFFLLLCFKFELGFFRWPPYCGPPMRTWRLLEFCSFVLSVLFFSDMVFLGGDFPSLYGGSSVDSILVCRVLRRHCFSSRTHFDFCSFSRGFGPGPGALSPSSA